MPKTRQAVSRDEKVGEILELAEQRLREGGYEALSVAGDRPRAGPRAERDLLVLPLQGPPVRRGAGADAAARSRRASRRARWGEVERILWFTDQFQALSDLRGAMNERARSSEVVADFVEELDALLSRMLSNALRDHVPAEELPVAVETFRATVEGTFVKGLGKRERRKVLTFTLERLMGPRRLGSAAMAVASPEIPGIRHDDVDAAGLRMHVVEAGPPDGDPVLVLHGWPQHWYQWRHQIPALAEAGYRVIVPDLRGFGQTEAPPDGYDKENMATDVLNLMDAMGLERVKLLAHDWGGWIAFILCVRAPERFSRYVALNIPHLWAKTDPRTLLNIWRFWYMVVIATPARAVAAAQSPPIRAPRHPGPVAEPSVMDGRGHRGIHQAAAGAGARRGQRAALPHVPAEGVRPGRRRPLPEDAAHRPDARALRRGRLRDPEVVLPARPEGVRGRLHDRVRPGHRPLHRRGAAGAGERPHARVLRARLARLTPIQLVRTAFPDRPAYDTAVSHAILERVARGELPETFRLARPGAMVAFGKQDVNSPGYTDAVTAAYAGGFEAVQRLAGGRAAVFHENTIAFAWAGRRRTPGPARTTASARSPASSSGRCSGSAWTPAPARSRASTAPASTASTPAARPSSSGSASA